MSPSGKRTSEKCALTTKSAFDNCILIISAHRKFPYVELWPNPVHNSLFSFIHLSKSDFLSIDRLKMCWSCASKWEVIFEGVLNPHFSQAIYCSAGKPNVCCVVLEKHPQRTASTSAGVFLRAPSYIHATFQRFATILLRNEG
jgi:hypothetical protein